jgi:hypothetical protein
MRVYSFLSIFVMTCDAILLIYFISVKAIDAATGKYGSLSYELVIVASLAGLLLVAFSSGIRYEKLRGQKGRRRFMQPSQFLLSIIGGIMVKRVIRKARFSS